MWRAAPASVRARFGVHARLQEPLARRMQASQTALQDLHLQTHTHTQVVVIQGGLSQTVRLSTIDEPQRAAHAPFLYTLQEKK